MDGKRYNPIRFLTNGSIDGAASPGIADAPVDAPAFSITKVTAAIATLVGPAVVAIVNVFKKNGFTADQYTIMFVGLVAFLAIVTAADVLARAYASGKKLESKAAEKVAAVRADGRKSEAELQSNAVMAARGDIVHFAEPLPGTIESTGKDPQVQILSFATASGGRYLVKKDDDSVEWVEANQVSIKT